MSRATSVPEHPGRDPEVAADVVRVDMTDEVLVDGCVRVVVVDHDKGNVVHACNLVRGFILFGGAVVGEDDKRHLLAEADVVL